MQEDSEVRKPTHELYKPRPWLLRTFVIGLTTGFVLGAVGTVILGFGMSWYGNTDAMEVFTGEKFLNYLPAIGLMGPLFALFAVMLIGITKGLERIKPPDDF